MPVPVTAKQALSAPVKVVYENGIAESVAFKDALKRRASGIYALKQDPAETFRELSRPGYTETMILGCTKGAATFVVGELARGQGGKMLIFGEHRYLPGAEVQHSLRLHDAGTQMISQAKNWSKAMASALNTGLFHTVPAKKQVITTTMSRPANSPDYLITWGILHLNDKAPEKLWDEEVERRYY